MINREEAMEGQAKKLGIYVHIPFCVQKCNYCDFLSGYAKPIERAHYISALKREIEAYYKGVSEGTEVKFASQNYQVKSIFLGGGTPSILEGEQIQALVQKIKQSFIVDANAEITIECNPESVTEEKLRLYQKAGINRLSFGLQSVNNDELRCLGRIHNYEEFEKAYKTARELGFTNINIDLILAIPGQTLESWEQTLRKAAALGPEHISAYSLIIEENTPFYERLEQLILPDEDIERRMYYRTEELLEQYGYERYEISNYCKKGYACVHNCIYWTTGEYLGIGVGAASYINGKRFKNTELMEEYQEYANTPVKLWREQTVLSQENKMEEFMFLGLRMNKGISKHEFQERFQCSLDSQYKQILEKLKRKGLIKEKADRIYLTGLGIDVSNYVFSEFLF